MNRSIAIHSWRAGYIAEAAALNDGFVPEISRSHRGFITGLFFTLERAANSLLDFAKMSQVSSFFFFFFGSASNFYSAPSTPTCTSGSTSTSSSSQC